MAISILNSSGGEFTNSSNVVTIPATTAGSTLIVASLTRCGTGASANYIVSVTDNDGSNPTYSLVINNRFRDDGGTRRAIDLQYRAGVPAGITQVTANVNNGNGMNMTILVLEVSGVNVISPLEGFNTREFNDVGSQSTSDGTTLTTAFTNALFVGLGIRTTTGSNTSGNGFATDLNFSAGSSAGCEGSLIASTSATYRMNHPFQTGQGNMIGIASFNPTPNSFTLSLSDSITPSDALAEEADYQRDLSDGFSITDMIDNILSSNTHFKTVLDTIVTADSLTKVWSAFALLPEAFTLTDNISFIKETQRTLSDNINIQDWMGTKKNSQPWSS